jgi:hypothetical protein
MPVKQKKTVQKKTVQKKRNSFGPKYWSEDKDSLDARKSLEARKGRLILEIARKQQQMIYKQEEFVNYITKKQEEMAAEITQIHNNIKNIVDANAHNFNTILEQSNKKNKRYNFMISSIGNP